MLRAILVRGARGDVVIRDADPTGEAPIVVGCHECEMAFYVAPSDPRWPGPFFCALCRAPQDVGLG